LFNSTKITAPVIDGGEEGIIVVGSKDGVTDGFDVGAGVTKLTFISNNNNSFFASVDHRRSDFC
jgi:hypothetical protein